MASSDSKTSITLTLIGNTEVETRKEVNIESTIIHELELDQTNKSKVPNEEKSIIDEMTQTTDERYLTRSLLGVGGFSLVHQVSDVKIGRNIAVKKLDPQASEIMKHNFFLEARVMSQLDHPGILPVYDFIVEDTEQGKTNFGYSMRIAALDSLHENLQGESKHDYHRFCNILRQVALALEHAHQRGVLHRDIKPKNILLGNEGEVYLTDWGVCTLLPSHPDYRFLSQEMKSVLVGTPAYMSPEQGQNIYSEITTLTDVYGLGASLYYALTGRSVYVGSNLRDVLKSVIKGEFTPPSTVWESRGDEFPYPKLLESICLKALSVDPSDRYQSAREFAEVIERFMNGVLEQERAKESAQEAYCLGQTYYALFIDRFEYQSKIAEKVELAQTNYKKSRTDDHRTELWALENQLDELLNPLEESFAHAISAFQSALRDVPDHNKSKASMTQLYKVRYQQALETNDQRMMIFFEERIKEYATDHELLEFEKLSEIKLLGLPKGTTVIVFSTQLKRYSTHLVEEKLLENYEGETILLKRGRYQLKLVHKEANETRIILWIKKYQQQEIYTPLPKITAIPEGFVYIKDRLAIGQHPVKISEYYEFLNSLPPDEAEQHSPRYHQTYYCARAESGSFELPYTDIEGDTWLPNWPAMLVSYQDACAYADWLSNRLSANVRIPTTAEWKEAASGNDGRPYPWGTGFDPSLCMMRESHQGRPVPMPVNNSRADCSPYGVYNVAGTVCQWSATPNGMNTHNHIVGASYNSMELMCHLEHTMQGVLTETFIHVGIRVAIELVDEDFLV
jgi:eukaryotic-like serine/threonine-protein kinase